MRECMMSYSLTSPTTNTIHTTLIHSAHYTRTYTKLSTIQTWPKWHTVLRTLHTSVSFTLLTHTSTTHILYTSTLHIDKHFIHTHTILLHTLHTHTPHTLQTHILVLMLAIIFPLIFINVLSFSISSCINRSLDTFIIFNLFPIFQKLFVPFKNKCTWRSKQKEFEDNLLLEFNLIVIA